MKEYCYIIIPIVTLVISQLIKVVLESIECGKVDWERFFCGSGGMPSSHTSFSFSLLTAIGIGEGISSPLFAIALVFSMIVAFDAMGLRMESGKQAVSINHIMDAMGKRRLKKDYTHLEEELGHSPLEVAAGVCFGILSAWIFMTFIF